MLVSFLEITPNVVLVAWMLGVSSCGLYVHIGLTCGVLRRLMGEIPLALHLFFQWRNWRRVEANEKRTVEVKRFFIGARVL